MKDSNIIIAFAATFAFALLIGFAAGRHYTISDAELIGANAEEYYISFGSAVHAYENNTGVR
jgi:hypothetical protein